MYLVKLITVVKTKQSADAGMISEVITEGYQISGVLISLDVFCQPNKMFL